MQYFCFVTYFSQPALERIKSTYCMGKKPFLFLLLIYMRFLTQFYAKTMGLSFIADDDSERVCRWDVFLNSVRPMGSTPFNTFPFWVLFCHITLERSWVIGFCSHFCWMYVATAITYSEPSPSWAPAQTNWCNRSSCVMIILTTYFRTTPMADVNFTSLVTS